MRKENWRIAATQKASQSFLNRWPYLEETGVLVVLRTTCWLSFHYEGSLLDSKATSKTVVQLGSCHEPTYVTLELRTDPVFQMQHSSWKPDNEWRVSSLVYDVFCSSLILITICSSFGFVFVRGGTWIFSTAAVRDVKTMNSIKSLYLYFLLLDETKRKALELICGCWGQKVFYIFWGGNLLQNKPKRRCRGGLLGAQLISFSSVLTQTFAIW